MTFYVGPEACFWADGGIVIHDNVIFAPRVTIFTSSHLAMDGDWLPYGEVSETAPVEIHSPHLDRRVHADHARRHHRRRRYCRGRFRADP